MTAVFQELQERLSAAAPATERVERLRDEYFTYRPAICLERALAYTRSYRETEGLAIPLRRALAFAESARRSRSRSWTTS